VANSFGGWRDPCPPPGRFQRQAEAEAQAFADFQGRGPHPLGGDQVQPAEFVVRAEVAPVGALGAAAPASAGILLHGVLSLIAKVA
jgi:hypothetical protein